MPRYAIEVAQSESTYFPHIFDSLTMRTSDREQKGK